MDNKILNMVRMIEQINS